MDYVLGEKVYGARCKSETGEATHRPSWILVLEYEYQLRKKAADLVNVGKMSIKEALEAARKDREVFQECFSTPLAIAAGQAAAHASLDGTSLLDSLASMVQRTVKKELGNRWSPGSGAASSGQGDDSQPAQWTRLGKGGKKGKAKGKTKGKAKGKAAGKGKGEKAGYGKIHVCAMRAGKCIKYNKNSECKVFGCEWPHEGCVCNKTTCNGTKHSAAEINAAMA